MNGLTSLTLGEILALICKPGKECGIILFFFLVVTEAFTIKISFNL